MSEHDEQKWRTDFPIESEDDEFVARRDFLRYLTLVSGGLSAGNGMVLLSSMKSGDHEAGGVVDICDAGQLDKGSWLVFHYPDEKNPAILIRKESGDYLAYTQKCPHLACPVSYRRASEALPEHIGCHCHNGKFDLETGAGVAGPPRELRPLRRIQLKIENGRVIATGFAGKKRMTAVAHGESNGQI